MKFSAIFCTLLTVASPSTVSALVLDGAVPDTDSVEVTKEYEKILGLPYPLVPMSWTGELSDGTNVTFNGTIETVAVKLEKAEPGIMAIKARSMEKRSFVVPRTPIWYRCTPAGDETWGHATRRAVFFFDYLYSIYPIEDAIRYLKTVGGRCEVAPHSCARISYSWNVGVYLCNDNDFRIGPWCDYQGYAMVQFLNDHCSGSIYSCGGGKGGYDASGGKIGDSERYTVTLQQDCSG